MLNNAVTIDYNYYFAWANKLSFECKLKEYDSALNTSQRMARIFSDNIDLVFFSGLLEFKTGHNTEAIAIFNGLIKQYSKLHDNNDNSDHIKTALLNKAIALKLLDKAAESKKILTDLSNKEKDPAVKKHINSYITKTKEKIINDMIDEK
jgi:tetratricopeptide (TPR) repeat protein